MDKVKLLVDKLEGKKSYLIACATALWALSGFVLGKFGVVETVNYLLAAGGLIGVKSALTKLE